jgi:hypothetical protein
MTKQLLRPGSLHLSPWLVRLLHDERAWTAKPTTGRFKVAVELDAENVTKRGDVSSSDRLKT